MVRLIRYLSVFSLVLGATVSASAGVGYHRLDGISNPQRPGHESKRSNEAQEHHGDAILDHECDPFGGPSSPEAMNLLRRQFRSQECGLNTPKSGGTGMGLGLGRPQIGIGGPRGGAPGLHSGKPGIPSGGGPSGHEQHHGDPPPDYTPGGDPHDNPNDGGTHDGGTHDGPWVVDLPPGHGWKPPHFPPIQWPPIHWPPVKCPPCDTDPPCPDVNDPVPEPATVVIWSLFALGFVGWNHLRRR